MPTEEIEGWLLDCYPSREESGGITCWLKTADGESVKLRDRDWHARIYASGSACDNIEYLLARANVRSLVHSTKTAYKVDNVNKRRERHQVIEIELREAGRARRLAELLENAFQNPTSFSLYNVDILPEQQYFYDKNLFPLAFVRAETAEGGDGERLVRSLQLCGDSVELTDYSTPALKVLRLDAAISDLVPTFDSRLEGVELSPIDNYHRGEDVVAIGGGGNHQEREIISETIREVERLDPDILVTRNGDAFVLPFLYSKAEKHAVDLKLNRDPAAENYVRNAADARTYFSYGKIMYRPATQRLFGRLHLDEENTFIYDQCRLQGLIEVSRLCRMPFHTSMRASIGKCLSGLQFYHALKNDVIIPWKPKVAEDFKSGYDLLLADRGGLVLEPLAGVFERVGELDFASLYPSIIRKYNISVETVNCECCSPEDSLVPPCDEDNESKNSFKNLGIHICRRERGIVAESLGLPLDKRFEYKRLRDDSPDSSVKRIYNERAGSLKWILVCCFGYLSYRNAKFGKIDSHIAVCAKARDTLLEAMHISEYKGFEVLHGIVDSLWMTKRKARADDYQELCGAIQDSTGFRISLEGIYKWIVFLPSRTSPQNQVANRYFGCFENGELKVRGIEVRRHDTPSFFRKCQNEVLNELAKCDSEAELAKCAKTLGVGIFNEHAERLERHDVPAMDLVIRRRLSKELDEYSSRRQLSVGAALKLQQAGLKLRSGQSVSYVITKYKSRGHDRAVPEELASHDYDSERYVELLADCCATVLSPFGVTKQTLLSRSSPLL